MSKGGGSQTTSTVQKADPWSGVQPALTSLYDNALKQYQSGGSQYYPGFTVAPIGDNTQNMQGRIYDMGSQQSPVLQAGQQQAYGTLNDQYLYSNPAMQDLYNLGGRDFLNSSPPMWDLYNSTGDQQNFFQNNPGMQGMQNTANGSMLNSNPYLDQMYQQASKQVGSQFSHNVMPGIASMFSAGGRYGSNQMADAMDQSQQQYGNTLSDLATKIYGGNYANERGLQQQAQSTLGQFGLTNNAQRQAALGQLGQIGLAGQGLQQSALGDLGTQFDRERALQTTLTGMTPALDQAQYYGPGQALGIGQQQDAYNQNILNSDMSRYNYGQQLPNQNLQQLMALLNGYPQGMTGSTQQPTPPSSPILGALGGAQLGGAMSSAFPAMGAALGPWGMIGGALLGGLFGH